MKHFISFTFLLFAANSYAQSDINTISNLIQEIQLENDLKYEYLISDNTHLCWSEFFTKTIACKNFETELIEKIVLREGRGPNEYQTMFGMDIINKVLYINDASNRKFIRIDLQTMEFLDDIRVKEQIHFFRHLGSNSIAVTVKPSFGTYSFPYLNKINHNEFSVTPLDWTSTNNPPDLIEGNFGGIYLLNKKYFVRVGNRISHLAIADFEKQEFLQETYDEPYKKQEKFTPTSNNLTQQLYFYIHDAELGKENKLYLLAEGKTKTRTFSKNELSVLDLDTMEYLEKTIQLPQEFNSFLITESYFVGFDKEKFTLSIFKYE